MGSNSAFLYIGFPSERGAGAEDLSRFDYDFFQLERAAAEGVSVDMLGKGFWACLQASACADVKATASVVSEHSMQKVKMRACSVSLSLSPPPPPPPSAC